MSVSRAAAVFTAVPRAGKIGGLAHSVSYIICATPRSGSNLLCEALWMSGVAGLPQEYFLDCSSAGGSTASSRAYLDRIVTERTTNGVFGAKVMWSSFDDLIGVLRAASGSPEMPPQDALAHAFPNLQYVYMTRGDKIRQAVSLAKAMQSGRWTVLQSWVEQIEDGARLTVPSDRPTSNGPLAYDAEQLTSLYAMLIDHDRRWESFFASAGIRPHRVTYEQLAGAYEDTARNLLARLGLPEAAPAAFSRRALERQSDAVNDDWAARLEAELARPRSTAGR